eukprot:235027_1
MTQQNKVMNLSTAMHYEIVRLESCMEFKRNHLLKQACVLMDIRRLIHCIWYRMDHMVYAASNANARPGCTPMQMEVRYRCIHVLHTLKTIKDTDTAVYNGDRMKIEPKEHK